MSIHTKGLDFYKNVKNQLNFDVIGLQFWQIFSRPLSISFVLDVDWNFKWFKNQSLWNKQSQLKTVIKMDILRLQMLNLCNYNCQNLNSLLQRHESILTIIFLKVLANYVQIKNMNIVYLNFAKGWSILKLILTCLSGLSFSHSHFDWFS